MDRDWKRLGKALKADRESQGLTQPDVVDALESSLSTIQAIERGQEYGKPTRAIRSYARLLNWTDGSVEQVLSGGDPNHVVYATASLGGGKAPADVDLDDKRLPLRIVHELKDDGALLDTTVIKVGDHARAVIVVKGDLDATAEEIEAALKAWRATQSQLQSPADGESPSAADGS
ncbi:helix-turn-helix domain-containing protein [Streptomyces sp. NBC_00483]|uniref:helix-turn-helix domain-containing protein n=1 Tax=Streptomyces sp. NBC_00483 TaxID=2975756 RepID=UPI002E1998F8